MLAILSAPGSRGDVNPMIAIGRELRGRGWDVVISISEPYAPLADAAGLHAVSIIDSQLFQELLGDPEVWTPVGGARRVLRSMVDHFLVLHHDVIRQHHRPGETVLVSHPLDFASRVVREADPTTPLVDVHLQPVALRTPKQPARLTPWWFEVSRPAWAIRMAYWLADHVGIDPVVRPAVNRLRATYQLPPTRRLLNDWWLSPDRIVALYPEWFAPATKMERVLHAGFPLADLDETHEDPPTDQPIVFTIGTAHHHCRQFFARAAEACKKLNRSGILLSTHAENFPPDLPSNVQTSGYRPLKSLLPHCSAIVHHGGIGTTSQALAAGTPQVIRPMAFDQFDNATRVESLGCGTWLKSDKDLEAQLQHVTESTAMAENCRIVSERLVGSDAVTQAVDEIVKQSGRLASKP